MASSSGNDSSNNDKPPGYKFIKNNLQGSKEPHPCIVLEGALRSRYNVQEGENDFEYCICSCPARRLAKELVPMGVVVEPTKASWTAGFEIRGFYRRRK